MGSSNHFADDRPDLPAEAGDDEGQPFEPNDAWLADASEDLQIEAMRRWFYARYEDPANQTPYSSDVGGYLFVWGGPYDPNDVIQERFSDAVPFEVMDKLIRKLWSEAGNEWAPVEHEGVDYDHWLSFVVVNRDDPFRILQERLAQIDEMLAVQATQSAFSLICQMAHSSLIAALEAYLADTVTYWVGSDLEARKRFVSRNKDFQQRSLRLSELFERLDKLDNEVTEYLQKVIWHRLDKVKPMMQAGLDVAVPDVGELMDEVVIRHDVVHRAGRTVDGDVVSLSPEAVIRVRDMVRAFAEAIETELTRRFPPVDDRLF